MASKANQRNAPVVAVFNMKGGVGKTTISAHLFYEMAKQFNLNLLLVDLDPQFNLSQLLMPEEFYYQLVDANRTIFHVFKAPRPDSVFAITDEYLTQLNNPASYLADLSSGGTKVHILPGDFQIASLNLSNPRELSIPTKRFRKFIHEVRQQYDLIVLDCNPSSSFLTRCGLDVATHLLVPVRPDRFSLKGLQMVDAYVAQHRGNFRLMMSIIINNYMSNSDVLANLLQSGYSDKILNHQIQKSSHLESREGTFGFASEKGGPWIHRTRDLLKASANEYAEMLGVC